MSTFLSGRVSWKGGCILQLNRLGDQWLEPLLDIELSKLQKRLSKKGITLTLTPEAKAYFCDPETADYDERFGARDFARRLRKELEPLVARGVLDTFGKSVCQVDMDKSRMILK